MNHRSTRKAVETETRNLDIAKTYLRAKQVVIREGFANEIQWQENLRFKNVNERDFLREATWVVLSCGMRETVVRKKFPEISKAFYNLKTAENIVDHAPECRRRALRVFNHRGKINAIITIARAICSNGFTDFVGSIRGQGIDFIRQLPYMGPATSFHLAKNIGLDVVKPDRHLCRVALAAGYDTPQELCQDISLSVGDSLAVVDIVLWRFATLKRNYIEYFH